MNSTLFAWSRHLWIYNFNLTPNLCLWLCPSPAAEMTPKLVYFMLHSGKFKGGVQPWITWFPRKKRKNYTNKASSNLMHHNDKHLLLSHLHPARPWRVIRIGWRQSLVATKTIGSESVLYYLAVFHLFFKTFFLVHCYDFFANDPGFVFTAAMIEMKLASKVFFYMFYLRKKNTPHWLETL